MGYDPTGAVDWGTFAEGAGLVSVGLTALVVATAVVSGGACVPLLIAAGATFAAGGMTLVNGVAEVVESTTGYNYMRDGVYKGDEGFYEGQKAIFETAAEVGTMAISAASTSPQVCFVAGTMILTANGAKNIETVQTGDYVWAWDEETGDVALKKVVETYINETFELIHVFVDGQEIIATPSHPFYSPVRGWTDAVHLRAGDILVLVNGEYVVVEKVQHEILETPVTVYNFQVEDYHTYFVANTGILVHNSCERGVGGKGWKGDRKWRENVETVRNGGDILELNGGIPSGAEARELITQAGGTVGAYHDAHAVGGVSTHVYNHIHYLTANLVRSAIQVISNF